MREAAIDALIHGSVSRLGKFGVVGVVSALATFALYRGLLAMGATIPVVVTATWAAGLLITFTGNRRYTFDRRGDVDRAEIGWFATGYVCQLFVGMAGFTLTLDVMGLSPMAAYFAVLGPTSATSFLFMRYLAFLDRIPADG